MKIDANIKSFFSTVTRRLPFGRAHEDPAVFKAAFGRFKSVLDSNNRALEIITDMGEKLGGDYLFDVVYVKKAYEELRLDIVASMENFDVLTGKRYTRLHEAFNGIDNTVRRALYDMPPTSADLITFLEDVPRNAFHDVGGKNAHLSEVKNRLKLTVPDAFVITIHAYDEFINQNGLQEKINAFKKKGAQSEGESKELRDCIMRSAVPPALDHAVQQAVENFKKRHGKGRFLAVRSSAGEEDGAFSFAGQFETVLNVPLQTEAVEAAYKKVIASLFSTRAIAYQMQLGYDIGELKMAVGCMAMVDAASSGVIYSTSPEGTRDTMIINATFGLGSAVVEGSIDADLYVVRKGPAPELIEARYGEKASMVVGLKQGGTAELETPPDLRSKPCLNAGQIAGLSLQAMSIEKYFGGPQDIEWAIEKDGGIFILQARPLIVKKVKKAAVSTEQSPPQPKAGHPVLLRNRGAVVQRGVGAGRVFIVREMDELDNVPRGAVLVAKHDSSLLVRVMPLVAAIITETGAVTSHMSAICRELKVPTIVNAGGATKILENERDVTVVAGDDGTVSIYEGIVEEELIRDRQDSTSMEDIYEYRKKRYILRYISPLNLVDPLMEDFTPDGCRTMHDILRFIHEKSVAGLVDSAREESTGRKRRAHIVKLDLPVPAGIVIMDMGGGLDLSDGGNETTFEHIASIPFKAVIKGMMHPGAWRSEAVSLKAGDFLTSMMRMSDIVTENGNLAGYNVAVISREYVNLSLRFGYHFTMLDCYCSENARNNHIYFRFVGGATDIVKRSRRVELIAMVLKKYGFNIKTKGDLIIARLATLRREDMESILDQIGRLIAYTRQLDAVLHDERAVESYARNFIVGDYEFKGNT